MGVARRAGTKFTAGMPWEVKSATFVHACFGSTASTSDVDQVPDERRVDDDVRGRRVADDLDGGIARHERADDASSAGVRSGG